jgi:hypothetical protein
VLTQLRGDAALLQIGAELVLQPLVQLVKHRALNSKHDIKR